MNFRKPLLSVAVCLILAGCQSAPSPEVRQKPKPLVYDFTAFDYTYARAYALQRTNLEPAPTSYVLFQPEPLIPPVTTPTPESLKKLQEKLDKHVTRVRAYCSEHESQFETLVGAYKADPFVNAVTFYWPLRANRAEEDDMRRILVDGDLKTRCGLMAEKYDYGRAHELLASLEGGRYKDNPGPVMVLDLGFDALMVPFDNVETENMERVPRIWKQAIDDTLKKAKLSRDAALSRLQTLETQIAELDKRAADPGVKKEAQRKAQESSKAKTAEKIGLLARWFGKGSWGRAILCGFSGSVIDLAGNVISNPKPIRDKAESWCGQPAAVQAANHP